MHAATDCNPVVRTALARDRPETSSTEAFLDYCIDLFHTKPEPYDQRDVGTMPAG